MWKSRARTETKSGREDRAAERWPGRPYDRPNRAQRKRIVDFLNLGDSLPHRRMAPKSRRSAERARIWLTVVFALLILSGVLGLIQELS